RVYDAATGTAGAELQIPPSPQGCGGLAFDPRGGRLAVATYAPTVDLYDLANGAPVRSFALPKEADDNSPAEAWAVAFSADGKRTLAFHPGGRRLFAGGGRSDLWDAAAGQQVLRFPGNLCQAAAFSPDGNKLAVSDGPVVRVYDATPRAGFPVNAPRGRTGPLS